MEDPADSGGGSAAEGPVVQVADIRWPIGALPLRLLEWKVKPGSLVNVDSVLALCAPISSAVESGLKPQKHVNRLPEKKVKSDRAGVIRELCCQLGQVIPPGGIIVRIEECSHPIVMKGLCAECGQDLTQLQGTNGNLQVPFSTATVSMVHSVPELMVSSEQAEQLGREDHTRLHRNRKLVLMVDLDQTLIHTTEQHCPRMSNKGIFHFQLGRGDPMLHTRLRPHCKEFLEKIAKLYELHVFTFGSRPYAHTIAGFLDPEKKLFSHRILSRDECIDPFSKTGNLSNLFPCGDSMVCIIDDREDVWKFAPNLITVKKYIYFQGTGDINAPPGSREAKKASRPAESPEPTGTSGAEEQNNGFKRRGRENANANTNTNVNNGGKEEPNALSSTQETPAETQRTHAPGEGKDEQEQDPEPGQQGESRLTQAEGTGKGTGVGVQGGSTGTTGSAEGDGPEQPSPAEAPAGNNLDFDLSSDSDGESVTEKPPSSTADSVAGGDPKTSPSGVRDQQEAGLTQNPECGDGPEGDGGKRREEGDAVKGKVEVVATAAEEEEEGKEADAAGNSATPAAEPPPVGPPGTEDLGNGCSDKREPETESQNSELSGVTAGEELLEQSMEEEEEEEEEADPDQDDHLIYLEEVLQRIHAEYYARYEVYQRKEAPEMPDVRRIVPELKGKVLEGATIVFSGLYPTNYPMERTREYYHAKVLGAKIGRGLVLNAEDPCRTTHLIAARAGTEKVRQALGCKHLHITSPDWLWCCLERWEKVEEQLYPLKEEPSKTPRSNSPAMLPDPQGMFHHPVFHPAHLHQGPPPPAPEVRIYDPVTGKLIRRGQHGQQPPPYLQAPGSMSQPDHRNTAPPRVGQTSAASDDEQPGPSRRKRGPSMSDSMPLYMLCKEDLDSMDKEVDDILGEESDNESEGQGKERPGEEEVENDDDEEDEDQQQQQHHQQLGAGASTGGEHTAPSLAVAKHTGLQTPGKEACLTSSVQRGHKRKLDEAQEEERGEDEEDSKDEQGGASSSPSKQEDQPVDQDADNEDDEEEEGSSSEADEMAAALDLELNDFM
ncbi:RNA polymerase II subunit A C-terminal domain phosphatase isoform X1 [Gadus morhua]|uniref:RNA polymerase II subunit A C-terminal domain phosphatase n=1 Tax=Gadus morhua TaxID=8049 RepID=A0A8C5ADZ3_GADMO|nr:RNA polymerase II subunit A C-terminal domain phosphatase isoform X1 [Gadus morhua]